MRLRRSSAASQPVFVPSAKVGLSTSSVYPESTSSAFELARRLGYDGVEVMVGIDPVAADIDAVEKLRDYHGVPVLSIHSPCLLITQRVWGTDPWGKLERLAEAAQRLDADIVVVHPLFAGSATTPEGSSRESVGSTRTRVSRSASKTCIRGAPCTES